MSNGFLSQLGLGAEALLLRVIGGVQVRPKALIVGSNLTLVDGGDGTATIAASAAATHTHIEADVTSLTTDLSGKATSSHTHAEADVTSLVADLAAAGNTGTYDIVVANSTGSTIPDRSVVRWSDVANGSGIPEVRPTQDTDNAGFGVPLGILLGALTSGGTATCRVAGAVGGLDTSGFSVSDDVYLGADGALATDGNVWLGLVLTADATTGHVYLGGGIGTVNNTPHHIHIGNGSVGDGGVLIPESLINVIRQQTVANGTGVAITKGSLLVSTPPFIVAGLPLVGLAGVIRGDFVGMADADIGVYPATGPATLRGLVTNLDTSAFALVGDPVYVGASGDLGQPVIAPTSASSGLVIGYVVTVDATTGSIFVWPDTHPQELYLREVATPATPAAGYQVLFIDVSDHLLKRIDSSATVTSIV